MIRDGQVEQPMVKEGDTPLSDVGEARQVVVEHHPRPPRPMLRRKLWARKLTKPIAKEFEMIDITTSPTRPSLNNAQLVVPEAYHRMLDNDWVEHDNLSITPFPFNLYFIGRQLNLYFLVG